MTTAHRSVATGVLLAGMLTGWLVLLGDTVSGGADTRPLVVAQVQDPARPVERPLPPQLLVRLDEDGRAIPLAVESARYAVTVVGLTTRTRATLVFRNDNPRQLDGELVAALPEGAVVSGFALDVNGRMVDGVAVGNTEARVAFESEVRRRVDPGLVEWVRGNNFRTRVWPIPAQGRRTVAVEYVSDLITREDGNRREALYELPLQFSAPLEELSVRIEVVRGDGPAPVQSGLANVSFTRWEDRYVAETTQRHVKPGNNLRVAIPDVPRESVTVEADGEDTYFVVDDFVPLPGGGAASVAPRRIGVLWDASLSRCDTDTTRELDLLAAHVRRLRDVTVDVVVFRNVADERRTFPVRGGDATALLAHLREQPCDGGTQFPAAAFSTDAAYVLLFSDGLTTLGRTDGEWASRPVYALSGDARADHARLRWLAERSGGVYLNLQRLTDAEAESRLGRPAYSLIAVEADAAAITDVEPTGVQPVFGGRVRVTGRLIAPEARLTLRYGMPGQTASDVRTLVVRRPTENRSTGGRPTGLAGLSWAQQRMAALLADEHAHADELKQLGQRFSLVTPGTSLLVLETLQQYLTHNVMPPASEPELRTRFIAHLVEQADMRVPKRVLKTSQVVAMWQRRVAWWEHDFVKYPAAGQRRNIDPAQRLPMELGGVVGGVPSSGTEAMAPADAIAPPSTSDWTRDAVQAVPGGPPRPGPASASARSTSDPIPGPATIAVKPWNPDTPYLRSLEKAPPDDAYRVYLAEREAYRSSPSFYLDCADFFFRRGDAALGLRVLTSVAELRLEDPRLMRVLAHRLDQQDEFDLAADLFERVLRLRPEEPQSARDLALVLDRRAGARSRTDDTLSAESIEDYRRALTLLNTIVEGEWDGRFPEIEVIAVLEANRIATLLERSGLDPWWPLDQRLRKHLDLDVRVVLTWDTDQTDMDLWVVEPTGERCSFDNTLTRMGGAISRDFTDGYGPEEYGVRRARAGAYAVKANFYGSRTQSLTGPTTVQATVVTDFGRPNEQRRALTLRLTGARDVVDVGTVTVEAVSGTKEE